MEANGYSSGHSDGHSNGTETGSKPHLLMIPMIQQAHVATAIRFAKKLSRQGVTITFVTIQKHADTLKETYSSEELQKLNINLEVLDDFQCIPSPLDQATGMEHVFQPLWQKLVADKKAGLPGPTALLADRFIHWLQGLAKELDIPRYAFASNAAVTSRLCQAFHELEDQLRAVPEDSEWQANCFALINKMPGLEFMKSPGDLPPVAPSNGWFDFFIGIGEGLSKADGIVFNSFSELESASIEAIRNAYSGNPEMKVAPVYPIGPISTLEDFKNESFVGDMEDSHAECLKWLGTQPEKSVLYVCLGSQIRLFGEQILHLARALENSQQRFLWVLSKGRDNFNTLDEILPEGYLARTSGRGKIVSGWVGQLEILAQISIYGFLSHCGWQSVMESMTCGVPVLGWPHIAEQRMNCRYLQEVVKVGLRITEKVEGEMVEDHEFESAIYTFMSEAEGALAAQTAAKLKAKAAAAVARGGSSDVAVDQLIKTFGNRRRHD